MLAAIGARPHGVFDMLDENDSAEWSTGHDCEPPSPIAGFGGYQVGFGTIDSAAGPRQGAVKSENADHLYGTIPMLDDKDNGMGDTLEFAESLGWVDENIEPWTPAVADATEASALDYIQEQAEDAAEKSEIE